MMIMISLRIMTDGNDDNNNNGIEIIKLKPKTV